MKILIWSQMESMAFISSWFWLPLIQSIYLHGGYGYAESQGMPPLDAVVCVTQEQCLEQFSSMDTGGNFVIGEFEIKGCFSNNRDIYFGTGGAVNELELAETDLPGVLERIWCDKDTNAPTMKPSDQLTVISATISASDPTPAITNLPTAKQSVFEQPWLVPLSVNPTSKPSHAQVIRQPTAHPMSNKPTRSIQTNLPTLTIPLVPGNHVPTTNNATLFPSTANRTIHLIADKEVTDSFMPTIRPSLMPASEKPTHPTANPSFGPSSLPTKQPSSAPTTVSPSKRPSKMPVSKQPTAIPTLIPTAVPTIRPTLMPGLPENSTVISSDNPQDVQNSAPLPCCPVAVSPLKILLAMDPQTESESVDLNELTLFILNHLLKEMEDNFLPIEGSSSYVLVSPGSEKLVHPQESPLESFPVIECEFVFMGLFYFSDSAPSVEMLDELIRESFAGESGKKFVRSLQNADDVGLRSTRSVNVVASSENNEVRVVANTLESTDRNATAFNRWYILAIVFCVGLLIIAMKVLKPFYSRGEVPNVRTRGEVPNNDSESATSHGLSRQTKSAVLSPASSRSVAIGQSSVPFHDKAEDESLFRSMHSSIRDIMSVFSIENIRDAASDIMSQLSSPTQDDDDSNMSDASTPPGPDPKQSKGSMVSKCIADHLPSYWSRNDGEFSYDNCLDDCNFCGIVSDRCAPSTRTDHTTSSGTKSFINDNENVREVSDDFHRNLRSLDGDCDCCFHGCADGAITSCSTRTELTGNNSQKLENNDA